MLCMIAKLDDASTEKLEALRRRVLPEGAAVRPLHGHVTIAVYPGEEERDFLRACRGLLADVPAFELSYERVELLEETSVLVASPKKEGVLDELHRRVARRYPDGLDRWTQTEDWHPHTSLLFGPDLDLRGVCRRAEELFVPFTARVCRIEFSRGTDDGYEILERVELTGGSAEREA